MTARAFENAEAKREFLRSVEQSLRDSNAEIARRQVHEKLGLVRHANEHLVDLALAVQPQSIALIGWDDLAERIRSLESDGRTITALGVDFSWPGHIGLKPDADGYLEPYIETSFYADMGEIEFSQADRKTLLEAYSDYGPIWGGCFEDIDNTIKINGLGELYGAIQRAEMHRDGDSAYGDAYVLAACTSAVLLHESVYQAILTTGLPKPLAVIVGSNEDYPFFNAPVITSQESEAYVRDIHFNKADVQGTDDPGDDDWGVAHSENKLIYAVECLKAGPIDVEYIVYSGEERERKYADAREWLAQNPGD